MSILNRRLFLGASADALAAPSLLGAQTMPIKLGSLTPLTGVGGTDGPSIRDAISGVSNQGNAA